MNLIRQILLILAVSGLMSDGFAGCKIILLPFKNSSGFEHEKWNIQQDISGYFADSLKTEPYYSVQTNQNVADYLRGHVMRSFRFGNIDALARMARHFDADAIISAEITEFEIGRLNLGTSIISGYGAYEAKIKISVQIYDRKTNSHSEKMLCGSLIKHREIMHLAAKPDQRIDYRLLDSLEFASPIFMQTILGEALQQTRNQFVNRILTAYPPPNSQGEITEEYFEGLIMVARQNEVYLNVGHAEKINPGEILFVYTRSEEIRDPNTKRILGHTEEKVGKIKILFIKDSHLSHATILEGKGRIKPNDIVRIRKR